MGYTGHVDQTAQQAATYKVGVAAFEVQRQVRGKDGVLQKRGKVLVFTLGQVLENVVPLGRRGKVRSGRCQQSHKQEATPEISAGERLGPCSWPALYG